MAESAGGNGGGLAIGTSEAELLRATRIRDDPADIAILDAFLTLAANTRFLFGVAATAYQEKRISSDYELSLTRASRREKAEIA